MVGGYTKAVVSGAHEGGEMCLKFQFSMRLGAFAPVIKRIRKGELVGGGGVDIS